MTLKMKLIIGIVVILIVICLGFVFQKIDQSRIEEQKMPIFCVKMADTGSGDEIYIGLRI